MKPLLIGLSLIMVHFLASAQCPSGSIVLGSQADIDNFSVNFPNCTDFNATILIDEIDGPVNNLAGLSNLNSISSLSIQYTHLENFTGLENLSQINEFRLFRNDQLQNFTGLEGLSEVLSFNVLQNDGLATTAGLQNLTNMGYLNLYANEQLSDLVGFSNITNLASLRIVGNNISSLSELTNLNTILDELYISGEPLTDLNHLAQSVQDFSGSLYLVNNAILEDVTVFSSLTSLDKLIIVGSENLSDFTGFENLGSVTGLFRIGFNPEISDFTSFSSLNSVGSLDIYENENLLSLNGLESLSQVSQSVYLMDNPLLSDIAAVENVAAQGLQQLVISRNTSLSVCDYDFVCNVIFDPDIPEEIQGNANGCNSVLQVAARCILGSQDQSLDLELSLWPNPAKDYVYVQSLNSTVDKVMIYTLGGALVDEVSSDRIDISNYAQGLYFLTVFTDQGIGQLQLIKQ